MGDIALPTRPSRGGLSTEFVLEGTSGGAVDAGSAVRLDSNGAWVKGDRDTDADYAVVALTGATAAGEPVSIMVQGIVAGFASLTPGVVYYLSDTAGRLCPIDDLTLGTDNAVPVCVALNATTVYVFGLSTTQLASSPIAIATPAQGNLIYRGASSWSKLAVGTKGQVLQTGGASANPAWGDVLQTVRVEPQADIGAGATTNVDIMKVPTGYKLTPVELRLQCGTTADATFSLQANDTDIATPAAAADDAAITTFSDTVDAGEVVRLEVVTQASTGDLDAPQFTLFYYLRPV